MSAQGVVHEVVAGTCVCGRALGYLAVRQGSSSITPGLNNYRLVWRQGDGCKVFGPTFWGIQNGGFKAGHVQPRLVPVLEYSSCAIVVGKGNRKPCSLGSRKGSIALGLANANESEL